jgi:nicotinic acid mononucleotide adenylyltransferase
LECADLSALWPKRRQGAALQGEAQTSGSKIFFTDVVMKDISATTIRRLAGAGRFEALVDLLPGPVLEYIKKYGIYKN